MSLSAYWVCPKSPNKIHHWVMLHCTLLGIFPILSCRKHSIKTNRKESVCTFWSVEWETACIILQPTWSWVHTLCPLQRNGYNVTLANTIRLMTSVQSLLLRQEGLERSMHTSKKKKKRKRKCLNSTHYNSFDMTQQYTVGDWNLIGKEKIYHQRFRSVSHQEKTFESL